MVTDILHFRMRDVGSYPVLIQHIDDGNQFTIVGPIVHQAYTTNLNMAIERHLSTKTPFPKYASAVTWNPWYSNRAKNCAHTSPEIASVVAHMDV